MAEVVALGRHAGRRAASSDALEAERRGGGAQRLRGDRALGRPDARQASTRPPRPCSIAYADPGVLASAMTSELRAERLLDGGWHTAYLCAPAHEQRRLQPLFATLVQEIVAHAYDRTTETGKPLDPPLLLVLDECANIAPLRDLATLASTGAGQGIQLVSVFQDMAQIYAVYGRDHAPTIVSNHRAKVILSGIADPQTLDYVGRLLGDEEVPLTSSTSGTHGPLDDGVGQLTGTSRRRTSCARCGPARASSSTATSRRRGSRCAPGSRTAGSADSRGARSRCRRPRYRERHPRRSDHALAEAPREAPRGARPRRAALPLGRPCSTAIPNDGLTVALQVDSRRRGDVLDLARVVEDDAAVQRLLRLVAPRAEPPSPALAPAPPGELRASRDAARSPSPSTSASTRAIRFAPACRCSSRPTVSSSTSTVGSIPSARSSGSPRPPRANASSTSLRNHVRELRATGR